MQALHQYSRVQCDSVVSQPCKQHVKHVIYWAVTSLLCFCPGRVGSYSAAQVEEVRMVMRMLPIFFTTILFWTIYCQARFSTKLISSNLNDSKPCCFKGQNCNADCQFAASTLHAQCMSPLRKTVSSAHRQPGANDIMCSTVMKTGRSAPRKPHINSLANCSLYSLILSN